MHGLGPTQLWKAVSKQHACRSKEATATATAELTMQVVRVNRREACTCSQLDRAQVLLGRDPLHEAMLCHDQQHSAHLAVILNQYIGGMHHLANKHDISLQTVGANCETGCGCVKLQVCIATEVHVLKAAVGKEGACARGHSKAVC